MEGEDQSGDITFATSEDHHVTNIEIVISGEVVIEGILPGEELVRSCPCFGGFVDQKLYVSVS